MVYHHPKAYFLGGENRWKLTWYDLERDRWGVCQVGQPSVRSVLATAIACRQDNCIIYCRMSPESRQEVLSLPNAVPVCGDLATPVVDGETSWCTVSPFQSLYISCYVPYSVIN
jgi:hypothetical protein